MDKEFTIRYAMIQNKSLKWTEKLASL